jgi:tRNA(Ile)-lysidine synthase
MPDAERDIEALSDIAADAASARRRGTQEAELLVAAARRDRDRRAIALPEFAETFEPLEPHLPLALAVSGGADSMALFHLVASWCAARGHPPEAVTVLTVDHGLRAEATHEAAQVAAWARGRGHPHAVLRHTGPVPDHTVQAAARVARFTLIAEWCAANGVGDVVLAHHQDDQAETFLLRLARGSGVDGLSAMRPAAWCWDAVKAGAVMPLRLLRPLLDSPKARLVATLRDAGQEWIEDPSNDDTRYARARLRRLMPLLATEGMTPRRLAATARRMAQARAALETAAEALADRIARFDPAGFCRLDPAPLRAAPAEVGLRTLVGVLRAVGGACHAPRLERTEALYRALVAGRLGGGRTLAGCRVIPDPRAPGMVVLTRETARLGPPLPLSAGQRGVWDGRFVVSLDSGCAGDGGMVRALGADGWRRVRDRIGRPSAEIPPPARACVPGLWVGTEPVAVPALGFAADGFPADAFRTLFPLRCGNSAIHGKS